MPHNYYHMYFFSSLLYREFLHPNFAQYTHDTTGNLKSSHPKTYVGQYLLILFCFVFMPVYTYIYYTSTLEPVCILL